MIADQAALSRRSAEREGGIDVLELDAALEISPATVKRHWTIARAWLKKELSPNA